MYKGFFEDLEYVAGLFFRPFEGCCEKDDADDDEEEKKCAMGCDQPPCCREDDDGDEPEEGLLGRGPLADIMKCLFDASDVDYDYED